MKITLAITLRDGRIATTTTSMPDDLRAITDFIAAFESKHSDAEFTITSAAGPHYAARFGDVASVHLEVELP
jgi:hypothetical protein